MSKEQRRSAAAKGGFAKQNFESRLNRVHKDIEKQQITKEVIKNVEKQVIPRTKRACLAATVLALHDKFGFGTKRLEKYMLEVYELFDSIYEGYVSFEEIQKCIYEELGIDFDRLDELYAEKHKKE